MLASFSTRIQQLAGDPTLYGIVSLFWHLIVYAQNQYTSYSVLNWLYLDVPQELWTRYNTTAAYPTTPTHPVNTPAYLPLGPLAENMAIQKT